MTEIFEARKPKEPAVIAEIDGSVELLGEKRCGKRTIIVRSESGIRTRAPGGAWQALASACRRLRCAVGEALVDGPLVHGILLHLGEEAVQI